MKAKKRIAAGQKVGKRSCGALSFNSSGFFAFLRRFKAAFLLAAFLLLCYFFLSQGNIFIEKDQLVSLSFGMSRPLNILSFMFAHISLWHLAVNAIMLLSFAAVVEAALSSKDVLAVFFFAGVLTVAIFSFVYPNALLMGASGGVFGLMACAFVLKPKKAIYAFAIAFLSLLIAFPALEAITQKHEAALLEKNAEKATELAIAVESGNEAKVAQAGAEKQKVESELAKLNESRFFAYTSNVDPFLHSYAAIFGIAYLLLFKRKETFALAGKNKMPWIGKH